MKWTKMCSAHPRAPHTHGQSSCVRHRCRQGGLCLTIAALSVSPRIDWPHRPRSLEHRQLHTTHVYTATIPQSLPPHARQRNPSRCRAIPRAIAENTSPKLNPVAPTTRGRVHSPKVKKPHVKSVTCKENARLFPPALKQHKSCSSRDDEQNLTKNVSQQRW